VLQPVIKIQIVTPIIKCKSNKREGFTSTAEDGMERERERDLRIRLTLKYKQLNLGTKNLTDTWGNHDQVNGTRP
jgi:hypothetical protein